MGLIGILLLIGIVKKNAIMMIDFALEAERKENMSSVEAIYTACVLRFRPIMMTTLAALFGGLPLALGTGTGSELRRPLGIAIVGGLIVSQALTLFTTPVVYLYLDRFRLWVLERRRQRHEHSAPNRPWRPSRDRAIASTAISPACGEWRAVCTEDRSARAPLSRSRRSMMPCCLSKSSSRT